MGALHEGHRRLVERARAENATVVASVFVNPLQFGPGEDFRRYPRTFERDAALLEACGVDVLYAPTAERMYVPGFATAIDPGPLGTVLEGAARPATSPASRPSSSSCSTRSSRRRCTSGRRTRSRSRYCGARWSTSTSPPASSSAPPCARATALRCRAATRTSRRRSGPPHRACIGRSPPSRAPSRRAPATKAAIASGAALLESPLQWEYLTVVDPATFAPLEGHARPSLVVAVARAGSVRLLDNVVVTALDGSDPFVTPQRRSALRSRR